MISSDYVQIVNDGTEVLMAGHNRDSFGFESHLQSIDEVTAKLNSHGLL
jgi:hypothetical protein